MEDSTTRVAGFGLGILGGRLVGDAVYALEHGQQYSVYLFSPSLCDASLFIDGKDQGTWRILAHQGVTLQRPAADNGHFTFFRADSAEGDGVGADVARDQRGLIRVVFRPGTIRYRPPNSPPRVIREEDELMTWNAPSPSFYGGSLRTTARMSSGVTGLTGVTNQHFGMVERLIYDPTQEVVIHARLVVDQFSRPQARPLPNSQPRSNAVPPPVD